jgi:hypothetical protein
MKKELRERYNVEKELFLLELLFLIKVVLCVRAFLNNSSLFSRVVSFPFVRWHFYTDEHAFDCKKEWNQSYNLLIGKKKNFINCFFSRSVYLSCILLSTLV